MKTLFFTILLSASAAFGQPVLRNVITTNTSPTVTAYIQSLALTQAVAQIQTFNPQPASTTLSNLSNAGTNIVVMTNNNGGQLTNLNHTGLYFTIHSNAWALATATNGMLNWDRRLTSSNGPTVEIWISNGVPFVYFTGTSGGVP
jgi:hypothetical protein